MRLYYYGPKLRDFEFPLAKHVEMSLPDKYDYILPFMADVAAAPNGEHFVIKRLILEHDLGPLPAEPNLVSYKGKTAICPPHYQSTRESLSGHYWEDLLRFAWPMDPILPINMAMDWAGNSKRIWREFVCTLRTLEAEGYRL